jgi:hypothetical protein
MAHALSDITLNSGDAAEVVISQITNISHSQNAELVRAAASGQPVAAAHFQGDTAPVTQVTSTDLATLLTLNSNGWLNSAYCAEEASSIVPFNKRAQCGVFDATSVHSAFSSDHVMVVPTSISGTGAAAVEVQFDLRYLTDDPFSTSLTVLSSQALTAAAYNSTWQLSKAFVGGTQIPELISATINPGITVTSQATGGGAFHDQAFITSAEPTITLQVEDLARAISVLNSAALGSGGAVIYFAKKAEGGTVVDLATTVHMSVTAATGIQQTSDLSVQEGANGSGTITLTVNNPTPSSQTTLAVATGVAVP